MELRHFLSITATKFLGFFVSYSIPRGTVICLDFKLQFHSGNTMILFPPDSLFAHMEMHIYQTPLNKPATHTSDFN